MTRTSTKLCILGITGSIGQQTIEVCKKLGYKIVGYADWRKGRFALMEKVL